MSIDIPANLSGYRRHALVVRTGGFWGGRPKLLCDGVVLERTKGFYVVRNDAGEETKIKLTYNFFDQAPELIIDKEKIKLLPAFEWYEYVWIWAAFPLLIIGGGLGGLVSCISGMTNVAIFRNQKSLFAKYGLSALVTLVSVLLYIIFATIIDCRFFHPERCMIH